MFDTGGAYVPGEVGEMVGGIILRRERGRGGQGVAYPCGLAVVTATLWAPPGL